MLDSFTAKHLSDWLDAHEPERDRATTRDLILGIAQEYPDLPERRTWREIADLARRNQTLGLA